MFRFASLFAAILFLAPLGRAQAAGDTGQVVGQVQVLTRDNQPTGDNSGVVVYLREVGQNKGFKPPAGPVSMVSENMEFDPEVLPILAGTAVAFPNDDDTVHNAFSISKSDPFDVGSYGRGPGKKVVFKNPGQVNVNCNLHPHMAAYILVLGNPYYAQTDEKGNYTIKDVPAGSYTLVCWFPYGFIQQQPVAVKPAGTAKADFELVKMRSEIPHKNKFGKSY